MARFKHHAINLLGSGIFLCISMSSPLNAAKISFLYPLRISFLPKRKKRTIWIK